MPRSLSRMRCERRPSRPSSSETAFPPTLPYSVEQIFERELPAERAARQRPIPKETPMTEHQTLTVRLHPDDNVVTARIDLLPNTAVAGEDVACGGAHPGRAQDRDPADQRRASRCASTTRSSASRARTSRPASTCTCTMSRCTTSPATTRSAPTCARPPSCPRTSARASTASCARTARPARATSSACSRP